MPRIFLEIQAQSADFAIAIPFSLMYKAAMTPKRTNPDFLNGVPELLILSLLSRRSMYGYELVQAIRRLPRERWSLARAASTRSSIVLKRRGCWAASGRP